MSVDKRPTLDTWHLGEYRPRDGRLATDYRFSIGKMATKYRQSVGQVTVQYRSTSDLNCRPTCRPILTEVSMKCRPSVGRASFDTRSTLDRYVGRCVGRHADRGSLLYIWSRPKSAMFHTYNCKWLLLFLEGVFDRQFRRQGRGFECFFGPKAGGFEQANFDKFKCPEDWSMLKFWIDWRINRDPLYDRFLK